MESRKSFKCVHCGGRFLYREDEAIHCCDCKGTFPARRKEDKEIQTYSQYMNEFR
jgi:hypothetical protein